MNETDAYLILNALPGLSNKKILQLIDCFGEAREVLKLSRARLDSSGILSEKALEQFFIFSKDEFLKKEYNLIRQHDVEVLTHNSERYPDLLKEISDRPVLLYVLGCKGKINRSSIGIVGSRLSSIYGRRMAEELSEGLVLKGFNVVSGLAKGIDSAAHKGALKAGGCTVAVLGSGLANIYPSQNEKLARQIKEDGMIVSEFPMQAYPKPYNFPRRNRIISGLSSRTIVVEAAKKSGALITADFALEQGRDVYAVPGMIDQPFAQGTNHLIQQGAKLITCLDDVLEDLQAESVLTQLKIEDEVLVSLSDEEERMLGCLGKDPMHIDEVVMASGKPLSPTATILLKLEFKKKVRQLPGKMYVRGKVHG